MRYFDGYAYYYELQRDKDEGFKKLKSEKPQYLEHVREHLKKEWNHLPKREYTSTYHSKNNPGHITLLKREHVFLVLHLERTEEKIAGGTTAIHETDLAFVNDSFCRISKRTDTKNDQAHMYFRVHKISDERLLTILKKDSVYRKFIKRINDVV